MQTDMWGGTESKPRSMMRRRLECRSDPGNSIGQTAVESVIDASGNIISSSVSAQRLNTCSCDCRVTTSPLLSSDRLCLRCDSKTLKVAVVHNDPSDMARRGVRDSFNACRWTRCLTPTFRPKKRFLSAFLQTRTVRQLYRGTFTYPSRELFALCATSVH